MTPGSIIRQIQAHETWPLRQQVMWPEKPLEYIILEEDEEGIHYGLFEKDRLISVISVFINSREAQFRKFATLTSEQGRGLGTQLLRHVLNELNSPAIHRIWCNAREDKAAFYERFGLAVTGQQFTKSGIGYVIMEKFLR